MAILFADNPVERFWDRTTVLYAAVGFGCYLASLALDSVSSLMVLAVAGILRLAPLTLLGAPSRVAWLVPYPYAFVTAAYDTRLDWLPLDWAYYMSGPTSFLVFNGGWMLASIPLTCALIARAVPGEVDSILRRLASMLFLLTSVGIMLMVPKWSALVLHYVAEPAALVGYATVIGRGLRTPTAPAT